MLATFSCLFGMGAYEILHFPKDARSLSLHNAASSFDHYLLRNNPAALSVTSENTIYSYLILPASIYSVEIQRTHKIDSGICGGKLSYISYGSIIDSETGGKTTAYDFLFEIGYKKELKNIISVGISGGYLLNYISEYNSQLLYINFGIRSTMIKKRIGFGLSIENVGYLISSYTDVKESIPTIFRSSLYYRPKFLPTIISIDIMRIIDRDDVELSGGLEFFPRKQLTLRFGLSTHRTSLLTDDFSSNFLADISGGVGFKFNKMNIDIGFMNLAAAGYVVGFSISKKID